MKFRWQGLKKAARKKTVYSAGILACAALLIVSFQNFSHIPIEMLKPQFNFARAETARVKARIGQADARDLAPIKPGHGPHSKLAVPERGSDLGSVGQDWFERQARILTGGAEKRFIEDLNRKMNRMISSDEDEEASASSDLSSDSAGPHASSDDESDENSALSALRPKSIRLRSLTRVDMVVNDQAKLSCSYKEGGVQFEFSRSLDTRLDLNVRHKSNDSSSSVLLNYSW